MDKLSDFFKETLQANQGRLPDYQKIMAKVAEDPDIQSFFEEYGDQLTPEIKKRGAASLFEFVSEKNKIQSGEETMVPGHYPKLILNNHQIEVTYVATPQYINDQKEKAARSRFKTIYLPNRLKGYSFSDIYVTEGRTEALKGMNRCIQAIDAGEDFVRGLYLHGSFGTGKTFMLGVLAKELADRGYEVIMVHYPQFTQEMKNSISDQTTFEKLEMYKHIPILILDDIGAEQNSSWLRDDILGVILQHRMQEELTTFFTSNMPMDQLEKDHFAFSDRGAVEERLKAARLMERIRFLAEEIEVTGENYRHKRDN